MHRTKQGTNITNVAVMVNIETISTIIAIGKTNTIVADSTMDSMIVTKAIWVEEP